MTTDLSSDQPGTTGPDDGIAGAHAATALGDGGAANPVAPARPPVRFIAVSAVLVLLVGLSVAWLRDRPVEAPIDGTELRAPITIPALTLTATDGAAFPLRDRFADRLTLVYFGYLNCPDACPITMDVLARALATMPFAVREQVQVVFVTTDPARDTPELIREYLDRFDASFVGLTAQPGDLSLLQTELLVPEAVLEPADDAGNYLVGHATSVFVFDDGVADERYPFGTRQSDWERIIRWYTDA